MNAYLDAFLAAGGSMRPDRILDSPYLDFDPDNWDPETDVTLRLFRARPVLTRRYAWAIPTPEAIDAIARLSPLVEIGAGTGYWAHLLSEAGATVEAFDDFSWGDGPDFHGPVIAHHRIQVGGPEVLAGSGKDPRTLLLCWPPWQSPMAAECLRAYRGDRLVLVGEGWGGCVGCEEFWAAIDDGWHMTGSIDIPNYPGIRDYVQIYERGAA